MIRQKIADAIIVLVSIAFAVNFGAQFVIPDWKPDPYIYGIFMTIVGGSFALRKDSKKSDEAPPSATGGAAHNA